MDIITLIRLDYISCVLTIGSTILIGKRRWQGWVIAAINSAIICVIGLRTSQTGLIPANLFCLGLYGYNILQWRAAKDEESRSASLSGRLMRRVSRHRGVRDAASRRSRVPAAHDAPVRQRDRIRPRELPARR